METPEKALRAHNSTKATDDALVIVRRCGNVILLPISDPEHMFRTLKAGDLIFLPRSMVKPVRDVERSLGARRVRSTSHAPPQVLGSADPSAALAQ